MIGVLVTVAKRTDWLERQLLIDPRSAADGLLPAQLTTFKAHQENPESRDL
ncbi:hypothetical protein [Sphingorhabdus sp.]|jgi:hypothetical protein|uniref:hypothetical protein n=1 Tax=Sphingorhabdus sp. TaxID=1902408 RepID=UPI0037C55126